MAYVNSVYDGDTITASFKIEGIPRKFSCRLEGFDCPEIKLYKKN